MRKYTKNNLKRVLKNTLDKIVLLKDESKSLSKKENKELLANENVILNLKQAYELLDSDLTKSCELICEIPYLIVGYGVNTKKNKKYKFVGSDAVYSRTDTLRHYCRMLPDSSFENSKIWNNVIIL